MKTKKFTFIDFASEEMKISDVQDGIVYVVRSEGFALLKCPCGCRENIFLSLIDGARPQWKIDINGNSISPSIYRTTGCKSHFTINNGAVNQ